MRDSAGIIIVENAAPVHDPLAFPGERTPVLSFGRADDEAIGSVRAAVRLTSGDIAFVDGQARTVRMFVPGEGLRDIARAGSGPGEVVFPSYLQRLAGDSIQMYDRRLGRITVFSPDGELAYEISLLRGEAGPPLNAARLQDTLLIGQVLRYEQRATLRGSPDTNIGVIPVAIVRYGFEGEAGDTIVVLPTGPKEVQTPNSSLMPAYGYTFPFDVTHAGILVHGAGDRASYNIMDQDGRTLRIHRFARARTPVDIDSLRAILSNDRPIGPAPSRTPDHPNLAPEFLPDSQPAYKHLRVFNGDQVWLGSAEPFLMPSRRWDVLGKDGRWIGTIDLPESSMLLDIADGHMVLRRSDELDVQYIEVYEIRDLFEPVAR